jgi:predicted dehydrogenase
VRQVLDKLRREGVWQTWRAVEQRLDVTRALGYSCAGTVLDARNCDHLRAGDAVACVGTDAATHGEVNFVPRNLCTRVPQGVGLDEAAFVALGSTALHAVHLSGAGISESVAVLGLGPVGLLLAQILRAAGCRVAAFDVRAERIALARELGIEWTGEADRLTLDEALRRWGLGGGFDRVFIAAASRSAEPVAWAVAAVRDRGQVVVVGDVPTDFPRAACYAKELSVVYARSYGPGRYDPQYEERGIDYPRAHVPWTLGRNLEAFLDLVARKLVRVRPLITHRFAIADAGQAYALLSSGTEHSLGVLLEYPLGDAQEQAAPVIECRPLARRSAAAGIGFIGAGNYAKSYLLPALQSGKAAQLVSVAAAHGASAKAAAERFGFARCTTDPHEVIRDAAVDAVFIATRHDLHGALALAAIEAEKAVFVEKPLCISEEELERIEQAHQRTPVPLMVGHNRRFAPATAALREFFGRTAVATRVETPLSIRYTIHARPLPAGHWLHDPAQGGRILGEVCHFVDWCNALVAAPLEKLFAAVQGRFPDENLHAVLNYADGSVATVIYDTGSHHALAKEVVEVSAAGRSATLEDFAGAVFLTGAGRRTARFHGKGQSEMVAAFLAGLAAGPMPVPPAEWFASARATLRLLDSASTALPVWL